MPQGPGTYGSKKGRPKKKKSLRSKAKGLVEKINPFDKESKSKRAYKKRVKSASFVGPKRKKVSKVSKLKSAVGSMTNKGRAKKIGAAKGTKVSKGAVGV